LGEHQLLVFLVDVLLLVVAARVGAEVAARVRLPLVVGEIFFGILVGPTLLGRLWPGAFQWLFPSDAAHRELLDGLSWIGILFLVAISGLETQLGLLRRSGRAVVLSWTGGFLVPFGAGLLFGSFAPASLIGHGVERPVFALFIAIAMAISAIPVIARILLDLGAYRTRIGMVILSSALADDTLGWVLLGVVSGISGSGAGSTLSIWWTAAGTLLFILLAFSVGQVVVRTAVRASDQLKLPHAQATVILVLILGGGVITQAIGVHMVLGAFMTAIVLGRTRGVQPGAVAGLRQAGFGFFIPFFFAYTGAKADLGDLGGSALIVTSIALAIACASKLIGGGVGARLGGMPRWEAMAVGVGLTARGAMELVIATIGLSMGVLSQVAYAMLVVVAVVTSVMAGPLLRVCLIRAGQLEPRTEPRAEEPIADLVAAGLEARGRATADVQGVGNQGRT
jgi:Kef-type K+ transport system membrane component KefB